MTPVIVVEQLSHDDNDLRNQILKSFQSLNLVQDFQKAHAVFIKPNLTYPRYKKGVTTRKEFVESLVSQLRSINSTTTIYIGEGEGGYNSFSMDDAFRSMGFYELENAFPRVKIINLSKIPSRNVSIDTPRGPYEIALPGIFFDEIDFSISCPLPKVHCMTKVTLSFKNQWGCLPDTMRLKNHFMFNHVIAQISEILKFKYAFLDGKFGLTDNGPMMGDPIEVNWFVASNSLGAFDTIISGMMGFDWRKVTHLRIAERYGFVPPRDEIEVIGDINALRKQFILRRSFWNYPALVAFHSKNLTQLTYLSKWAKLIHDVMYTFRERPIE